MRDVVTVQAPGKLMIAGEYAVLGPAGEALVLAVDPGHRVTAEPASRWEVLREDTGQGWADGQDVPPALSFACAAVDAVRGHHSAMEPLRLTIATDPLWDGPKRGYGSSASVTVAVVGALHAAGGAPLPKPLILKQALAVHRAVQDGMGSGTDVAASAMGGLVHWCPARLAGVSGEANEAHSVAWPQAIHMAAGYTGHSASTRAHLEAVRRFGAQNESQLIQDLMALGRPAAVLIDAFKRASPSAILASIAACHDALVEWDLDREFGIITPPIEAMVDLARSQGAQAKVSGAGGGDSVLVFADEAERLNAVIAAWEKAGFETTSVQPAPLGVHVVA